MDGENENVRLKYYHAAASALNLAGGQNVAQIERKVVPVEDVIG